MNTYVKNVVFKELEKKHTLLIARYGSTTNIPRKESDTLFRETLALAKEMTDEETVRRLKKEDQFPDIPKIKFKQ